MKLLPTMMTAGVGNIFTVTSGRLRSSQFWELCLIFTEGRKGGAKLIFHMQHSHQDWWLNSGQRCWKSATILLVTDCHPVFLRNLLGSKKQQTIIHGHRSYFVVLHCVFKNDTDVAYYIFNEH